MSTLKRTTGMAFIVAVSIVALFSAFKIGEISQEFKAEFVDLPKVCNYCVGDRWPQQLEISRTELRVTCGKGELERVGVLNR